MLNLNIKTFKKTLDIVPEICESFKHPLIFYLTHKNDKRSFFITFVILDFTKRKLRYIISYLPENILKIKSHSQSNIFRIPNSYSTPHCTIQATKDSPFLTFVEYAPYFFEVDFKKNNLHVYFDDDFKKDPDEIVNDFSPTVFRDETDPQYFHFYSGRVNRNTGKNTFVLHKASMDLSQIESLHNKDLSKSTYYSPHTVKKIGHYVLTSHFLHCQLKNTKTGRIFNDSNIYALFVYESLYEEYCQKKNIPHSKLFVEKKIGFLEIERRVGLKPDFSAFCDSRGKDFMEICIRNQKYSFVPLAGLVTLLNLDNKEEYTFETTVSAPAHFEIDKLTDDIFISSHSFIGFGRTYLWGPAAIDHFRLENGMLVKISTFSHPTGYRFTSHKVFSWEGKTYICTFGQPNRLFFIDAETMQLEFFEDIEIDFLSNQPDIYNYINYAKIEPFTIKTLEVSADGQFIFFLSHDYIYFYSFPKRKIVQKIKYLEGTSPDGEISLSDFYKRTTHASYLN